MRSGKLKLHVGNTFPPAQAAERPGKGIATVDGELVLLP